MKIEVLPPRAGTPRLPSELVYAGLFAAQNVPDEALHPFLLRRLRACSSLRPAGLSPRRCATAISRPLLLDPMISRRSTSSSRRRPSSWRAASRRVGPDRVSGPFVPACAEPVECTVLLLDAEREGRPFDKLRGERFFWAVHQGRSVHEPRPQYRYDSVGSPSSAGSRASFRDMLMAQYVGAASPTDAS